jgi:hypothetical protein
LNELTVTEFKDLRVLTTQQLADKYESDSKTLSNNFNRNKDRYKEGKHYILLQGEELKAFKTSHQFDESSIRVNQLYLWTEKGCLLHAKSLGTDKAWEVYENLVDTYFKIVQPKTPIQLLEMEIAIVKAVSEKVDSVDRDLQKFKQDMPILGIEESRITNAVKKKGVSCLSGKESAAYSDKSLRGRVYSDIYGQLKREFGVGSYKAIKRSQADMAVKVIGDYKLPYDLQQQIDAVNNQLRFGKEEIA